MVTLALEGIEEIGPFAFRWPDGTDEDFDQGWEASCTVNGRTYRLRHGLSHRNVYGSKRRHSVTFVNGQPRVEGAASDDYDTSRGLVSLLRKSDKTHIRSESDIPHAYEALTLVRQNEEIRAPNSSPGFAVKIREDDLEKWALHALVRQGALSGAPVTPLGKQERSLHLLLRWSVGTNPRTVDLHRQVADAKGSVWWGKFGDPQGRTPISDHHLVDIRRQIRDGIPTYTYLYRAGETWRATLLEITRNKEEVDPALIPEYYGDETHHLWVRLKDFELLEPDWPIRNLTLATDPVPGRLERALRGQASMLLVTEVDESGPSAGDNIQRELERILEGYSRARGEPFSSGHPIWESFLAIRSALERSEALASREQLEVRASAGEGNWAKVPWIALLDRRVTRTIRDGVYVVYLFRQDCSGVYLTLNQGVTKPRQDLGARRAREVLRDRAARLRQRIPELRSQGFFLDDQVDLRADPGLGAWYEESTIAYKLYETGRVPKDRELLQDLEGILRAHERYARDEGALPALPGVGAQDVSPNPDLRAISNEFATSLRDAHVSFGSDHDDLVRSFISSLASKRFVILTGLSGSGKTQLALRFGEWLGEGRYHLEAVRPDWTGAESLFGFEDALQPAVDGRRAWHVPRVLRFMLQAARDLTYPYLLVLDEMNLAHVERYFADVLSGMESDYPVLPNLNEEDDGRWRLLPDAEERIPFPPNLFVVGTVNIDETTYLFSPKVLDRANVFEFRVKSEDLSPEFRRPVACKPGSLSLVRGFLTIGADSGWHLAHLPPQAEEFQNALRAAHRILSISGYEFGHRVFYEAVRFAAMLAQTGEEDWRVALDRQVIQKLLPRLHGSRRQLEGTLISIARFCYDLMAEPSSQQEGKPFDPLNPGEAEAILPISFDKIQRMTRSLRANQFASFTE